jgi:hypothetical protein
VCWVSVALALHGRWVAGLMLLVLMTMEAVPDPRDDCRLPESMGRINGGNTDAEAEAPPTAPPLFAPAPPTPGVEVLLTPGLGLVLALTLGLGLNASRKVRESNIVSERSFLDSVARMLEVLATM